MIRTFGRERDLEAVRRLWEQAGPGVQLSPSDSESELKKKLARDADLFLVAEQDGRMLGAVLGGFDGRRGMVYHLAVRPDHRRRGIGRALMDELERRLQGKGCLKSYLLVRPDNQGALAFYRTLGWDPMNLQVMGKVLE